MRLCSIGRRQSAVKSVLCAFAVIMPLAAAAAFEVPPDEKEKLQSCEKDLCAIILKKEATGSDLACELSKTWSGKSLAGGLAAKSITWAMGDARCSVTLNVKRAMLVDSLNQGDYELKVPEHAVVCEVEGDKGVTAVTITLAPTVHFKQGVADGATLGVTAVDAPTMVKGAIWSVAKFQETLGLFESDMVEQVNKFIGEKCPKKYGAPQ